MFVFDRCVKQVLILSRATLRCKTLAQCYFEENGARVSCRREAKRGRAKARELLPTTYYLLPTTYYLLPTTYYHDYYTTTTYYLLLSTYYLLPTTYYPLLPTTTYYYLPTTTYYYLPLPTTTYYLLLRLLLALPPSACNFYVWLAM